MSSLLLACIGWMFWTAILICQRLHIYIWQVTLFVMWCEGLLNICRSFCTFLKCADEDVNQQSIKRTVGRRVCRHSLHKTSSPCLSLCSFRWLWTCFSFFLFQPKCDWWEQSTKKKNHQSRSWNDIKPVSYRQSLTCTALCKQPVV